MKKAKTNVIKFIALFTTIVVSIVFQYSNMRILFNANTSMIAHAISYNSYAAVDYASRYWQNYNPNYFNYNSMGGDCANFVSQCLRAGGLEMTDGWYWDSYNDHSASWISCRAMYSYFKNSGYTVIENPSNSQVIKGILCFTGLMVIGIMQQFALEMAIMVFLW